MTIKMLNKVMRNPKLYAQTKAIYSYLYVRADHKRDLAYPTKQQMLDEIHLTGDLLKTGLGVLEKQGYIKIGTAEGTDKTTGKPYTYTTYQLINTLEG